MEYRANAGEVEITGMGDFNLERVFECGQCFRWDADDSGAYFGVAKGIAARVRCEGGRVFVSGSAADFENVWRDYFDLDRDYGAIREVLCVDGFMREATEFGAGIRILRQDKWEALCSFIISQCNNIPRIKSIINTFCRTFGDEIVFDNKTFYTFPDCETTAGLCEEDLSPLRCGYRAAYILAAARDVAGGKVDLEEISKGCESDALEKLKKIRGVGDKVANCVILFGLHMLDAFPLDVWMKRAVKEHYGKNFDPKIFSPYAGIAQQYIFYYTRSKGIQNEKIG